MGLDFSLNSDMKSSPAYKVSRFGTPTLDCQFNRSRTCVPHWKHIIYSTCVQGTVSVVVGYVLLSARRVAMNA